MRRSTLILWGLVVLGLALRLVAMFVEVGGYHPDAVYQYLEPAYWHVYGYGSQAWEWMEGARSWFLPALTGAWLAWLDLFGVHDGMVFHQVARLQYIFWGLLLVPAGFLIARRLAITASGATRDAPSEQGWMDTATAQGLGAAACCALLPSLVYYSYHPLSELPAMALTTWAYVSWLDLRADRTRERKHAFCLGVLMSSAIFMRPATALVALVPGIDLVMQRRGRAIGIAVLAGLVPALAFGGLDWLTFGRPFNSLIVWVDFNLVRGRAGMVLVGETSATYYVSWMGEMLNFGLLIAYPALLLTLSSHRPLLAGVLLPLLVMSLMDNRQDRFLIVAVWPFLAISIGAGCMKLAQLVRPSANARAAAGADESTARLPAFDRRIGMSPTLGRHHVVLGLVMVAFITAASTWGLFAFGPRADRYQRPPAEVESLQWGQLAATAWVGRQSDASGVLVHRDIIDLTIPTTYFYLGRNIPMQRFDRRFAENRLFNYALIPAPNEREVAWCETIGFQVIYRIGGVAIMWRQTPQPIFKRYISEQLVGGEGGQSTRFLCPEGQALGALDITVTQTPPFVLSGVLPRCRLLIADQETPDAHRPRGLRGPPSGNIDGVRHRVECPPDQVVIGLYGAAGGYVDSVGLLCGRVEAMASNPNSPDSSRLMFVSETSQTAIEGGPGGSDYDLQCPPGSVTQALMTRAGRVIDAIGIACVEL